MELCKEADRLTPLSLSASLGFSVGVVFVPYRYIALLLLMVQTTAVILTIRFVILFPVDRPSISSVYVILRCFTSTFGV